MTQTEAMKLALEALYEDVKQNGQTHLAKRALPELREALAQPAQKFVLAKEDMDLCLTCIKFISGECRHSHGPLVPHHGRCGGWWGHKQPATRLEPEQEPVAEVAGDYCNAHIKCLPDELNLKVGDKFDTTTPQRQYTVEQLRAATPQRHPLTDEQIEACLHQVDEAGIGLFAFARAIEAAHGIGVKT